MTWLLPLNFILRRKPRFCDRHRPGYWREYHQRNLETRRPYLAAKRREYKAAA